MTIICQNCGHTVAVNGLGRKRLDIPVINIIDAIKTYPTVTDAAQELECSEGYIFGVLKANEITLTDIVD